MPIRVRSAWLMAVAACFGSGGSGFAADAPTADANAAAPTAQTGTTTPAATNTTTSPPTALTAPVEHSPELEEIVVTGMRASLEKSLQIKRDASVVLDSINETTFLLSPNFTREACRVALQSALNAPNSPMPAAPYPHIQCHD